jgi:hypothetical protein
MFLLPLTNSFSETWLKFRKRVPKRIRAVAVVRVNFFRLVVALLADWSAVHEQRNVRVVEENGSISTQRLVFLVCCQRSVPFYSKTLLTVERIVFSWAGRRLVRAPSKLIIIWRRFKTIFFNFFLGGGGLNRAGEIFWGRVPKLSTNFEESLSCARGNSEEETKVLESS